MILDKNKKRFSLFRKKKTNKSSSVLDEFEQCVLCKKRTVVAVSTPIEIRECYEIGCGQLCLSCYEKLHNTNKGEPILSNAQIALAVEECRKNKQ